jgi:hypothetical protein
VHRALLLTAIGRTSGQERSVIIGYVEDGANLVALAMNGWDEGDPSWHLNLEAILTPRFASPVSLPGPCMRAKRRAGSSIGCGRCGSLSIPSSTPTQPCAR